MNPIAGGDQFFVPMNMVPLTEAAEFAANKNNTAKVEPIVENIATRIANAECVEVEKHLAHRNDDSEKFRNWVHKFYEKHEKYIFDAVKPLRIFNRNLDLDFESMTMKKQLLAGEAVSCDIENMSLYLKNYLLGALNDV
jgi:hypothetical protein